MTVFYTVMALCLFVVVGLVWDGGAALDAASRADEVAQEAARAGGEQIDPTQAIPGKAIVVSPTAAESAARSYLSQAGVNGTVSIAPDGQTLTVEVTSSYQPVFATLLGITSMPIHGHGTAHLLHQAGG
ncbi:pilus assembly protein TadG-related protein [Streptantibioticus ferralitis]|uniref:Pilus assembly protein TadG-related protein n=1 Tax=Streptantibioticus ferralitis TaxID=236510 RepID=A0ABT5Z790_9ACTN|nr:pilus assembly protein TadG-related protein [Streptantibioticus ferralitis]MDF2259705.1 pilus assembly protein TadG-related protein [Streptantibioticus ferralitis]